MDSAICNRCRCGVELAKVLIIVPLQALLDQFAPDFPGFCKVGTGHNQRVDFGAKGFIAVTKSVDLLQSLKFQAIFVDEAHHRLPSRMPKCKELYRFSATHTDAPDFCYPMGQAIEDGVLCDYDITVPAVTEHHAYVCLADLLLKQAGQFRRVLAYCNTVSEAKKFQMVLEEVGLAAWHINAATSRAGRMAAIEEFSANLTKPVHVMVTVEVLGEGINIPNADTCMFVEPRNSYRSVIQAIGRVLRHHPGKTLAHIVLPSVAVPARVSSDLGSSETGEAAEIFEGHAATCTEHEGPQQFLANFELPEVDTPRPNIEKSGEESNKDPCWPTQSTTSVRGIHAVEACTREDRAGPPTFHRGIERGVSNAEERKTRQEEPNYRPAGIMGKASEEGIRKDSFNLTPSGSSTWSSLPPSSASTSASLVSSAQFSSHGRGPVVGQAERLQAREGPDSSPMLRTLSASGLAAEDRLSPGFFVREGHSGANTQPNPFNGVLTAPADSQRRLGDHGADRGPSMRVTIKEDIEDTAWWEQLHDFCMDRPSSSMEQLAALRSSVPAQQRRTRGPPSRRMQLKTSQTASELNELYGAQLERFLSLLVQADSRLVGSSVGYLIQVVDCRMTVVGQELDSLTEAVYRRLTAILRRTDPWEDNLQSLEAFVEKIGRLPLRTASDEKHLGNWLSTQRAQLRAGLLLENRWQRLLNSSSALIRQRVQGWPLNSQDSKFKRRCLELKAYIEMNGELPRFSSKTPNSQSHQFAAFLSSLRDAEGWTRPDRRAMLESLHPLMAKLVVKWDTKTITRVNLPIWQKKLQRLVAWVQAKGRLPSSTDSGSGLYDWLRRNVKRLEQLPRELVQQLLDSHPLIAAKVHAAQTKRVERVCLKRSSQGQKSVGLPRMLWGEVSMVAPSW